MGNDEAEEGDMRRHAAHFGKWLLVLILLLGASGLATGAQRLGEALPVGERPETYWNRLEALGFRVISAHYRGDDYLELRVVGEGCSYEVQIEIDPSTHTSTSVYITPLSWKTKRPKRP